MTTADQVLDQFRAVERRRQLYTGLMVGATLVLLFGGFYAAEDMNSGSFVGGLQKFLDYPADIMEETFEAGWEWFAILAGYLPSLIETINMAAVSTIFGVVFATGLAFCSTRNFGIWGPLVPVARRVMDVSRAFPELIIALFLIFILGATPLPAVIAIAIHTAGALGKQFSEVNENIDRGPLDGLSAVGANWTKRMRFAVIPQVLPNYLSYLMLRFEINIRASAILGFVGAGGIGQELRKAIGWGHGADVSALFVLLFVTIVAIDQVSSYLRRRIIGSSFVAVT